MKGLNEIVRSISDAQGRLDGLIAAAGIQQETPALDYTAKDANMMFEVSAQSCGERSALLQQDLTLFGLRSTSPVSS